MQLLSPLLAAATSALTFLGSTWFQQDRDTSPEEKSPELITENDCLFYATPTPHLQEAAASQA